MRREGDLMTSIFPLSALIEPSRFLKLLLTVNCELRVNREELRVSIVSLEEAIIQRVIKNEIYRRVK